MLKDLDFVGYRYVCPFTPFKFQAPCMHGINESYQVLGGSDVLCNLRNVPTTVNNSNPKDWTP